MANGNGRGPVVQTPRYAVGMGILSERGGSGGKSVYGLVWYQ